MAMFSGETLLRSLLVVSLSVGASACNPAKPKLVTPPTSCKATGEWKTLTGDLNVPKFAKSLGVSEADIRGGRINDATCNNPIEADQAGNLIVPVSNPPEKMSGECLVIGIQAVNNVVPPANQNVSVLCSPQAGPGR